MLSNAGDPVQPDQSVYSDRPDTASRLAFDGRAASLSATSTSDTLADNSVQPQALTGLTSLWLQNNQLSGEIPASFTNLTSLSSLDIGYNGLSAVDAAVRTFLNSKDPDWANTQTVAPSNLRTTANATQNSITVSWTRIPYVADGGYYEISYALASEGVYEIAGTTANKSATSFVIASLVPGTEYNFRVRTYTPAHGNQQNDLWSDYSDVVTGTIVSPPNAAPPRNYFTTETPTLSWNHVTGAETYEIQVDTATNFAAPLVFTTTVPASDLAVTLPSLDDGVYYWRVRANSSTRTGAWSAVDSFTVDVP